MPSGGCPCLIPPFLLPSLLPACLPEGVGSSPGLGMSLGNPLLFDPHLGEVSREGQAPPGQFVCALSSLENWDAWRHWEKLRHSLFLQEELALALGVIVVLTGLSLGCSTVISCLFLF